MGAGRNGVDSARHPPAPDAAVAPVPRHRPRRAEPGRRAVNQPISHLSTRIAMPMTRSTAARLLTALLIAAFLAGCSTWKKVAGEKADYKQSRVEPSLEIPPDLSSATIEDALVVPDGGTTTLSEYAAGREAPGAAGAGRGG